MLIRRLNLPFQMMAQLAGKPSSKEPEPEKKDVHNPTWRDKIEILKQMKPYIIPFLH